MTEQVHDCLKINLEMARRDWKFRVRCNTGPGETVCVVGNCEELGGWKSRNAVMLTKEISSGEDDNIWSCVVSIPLEDVEYRYLVCVIVEPNSDAIERLSVVRLWETSLLPRVILQKVSSNILENPEPEEFGLHDNKNRVERGWLTGDTVLQLKLFDNPIQLWKKKLKGKKVSIKVNPVSINTSSHLSISQYVENSMDESLDTMDGPDKHEFWPIVEVVTINPESANHLKRQPQFGCIYNEGDFLMFQIHVSSLERVVLAPITDKRHRPVGQLCLEYVVIRPVQSFECDMSASYATHWKHTWKGLDVGHRGAGVSFCKTEMK
ncbi:hypothetical protein J437_LFUL013370, partial [Ladona fulva]